MTDNNIQVALSSDDNYFVGLLTTAWSIARNCSRPHKLIFHILDGGIAKNNWHVLHDKLSEFGCTLDRITVAQSDAFPNFKSYHGSRMTYARLLLPELLPTVDMVIYADVDILWLADIAELWDILDSNAILHFCAPCTTSQREIEWFASHGFPYDPNKRFCAGILAMNLRMFRREKLHIRMLDLLHQHKGDVPNFDETVLNAFMFGRLDTVILSRKWHTTTGGLKAFPTDGELVLHFAADTPWKSIASVHRMLTEPILLWHRIHGKIKGLSTWASLRTCNSISTIIIGRTLYLAASNFSIFRRLLELILILKGQRAGIKCLNDFMHKVKIPRRYV